jgi:hypothetical protein
VAAAVLKRVGHTISEKLFDTDFYELPRICSLYRERETGKPLLNPFVYCALGFPDIAAENWPLGRPFGQASQIFGKLPGDLGSSSFRSPDGEPSGTILAGLAVKTTDFQAMK